MGEHTFMLGTWQLSWLEKTDVPLFVSYNWLKKRKKKRFDTQKTPICIDSGGFTELSRFGGWNTTPEEYVDGLHHLIDLGLQVTWASQQDWMVEPEMIESTGLSLVQHQKLTVDNFLKLRSLTDRVHIIPVLQGQTLQDYYNHFEMFESAGVDLRSESVVGVGSVCRRQNTSEVQHIMRSLHAKGLNLHGFGVKTGGKSYSEYLVSSDSMAWSYDARRTNSTCSVHDTGDCRNCMTYALEWRDKVCN